MRLNKIKSLLTAGLLLAISATAHATDYGRWLCGDCGLTSPAPNVVASGEIVTFLRTNRITDRWKPMDTISICDGTVCVPVVWRTTVWYYNGFSVRDPKIGYKNSSNYSQPISTVNGSTGPYTVSLQGHWEWWDYYSNGEYTGSGDWEYVVDTLQVTYFGSAGNGSEVNIVQ
jgi:hypothetical protein